MSTQNERIVAQLKRRWLTAMDVCRIGPTTCPHKRLSEIQQTHFLKRNKQLFGKRWLLCWRME